MRTRHKSKRRVGRLLSDQRGQGLVFTAVSVLVLVGFVVLVLNIGRLTERRTKIQIVADNAAYSGAVTEANSLSTIAWLNSGLGQCYYNAVQYGVNECVSGTAALMQYRIGTTAGVPPEVASSAMMEAQQLGDQYREARTQRAAAVAWMQELSQIEVATALLSPKLAEEEMFAVVRSSFPEFGEDAEDVAEAEAAGARIATYPSLRLFPHGDGLWRFLIKHLFDQLTGDNIGWLIADIDTGEEIRLELLNEMWYVTYSTNGLNRERYIFHEVEVSEPGVIQQWEVRHEEPPGQVLETIIIVEHEELGWILAEDIHAPGRPPERRNELQTRRVDMDGDGTEEGTEITYGGRVYIFRMTPQGELEIWDSEAEKYVTAVSNRQQVGEGMHMTVNTVNRINLSHGGWATIGNPTVVHMGPATITLAVPPRIHCGFGVVTISVQGFDEDSLRVGVGGYDLTVRHGDGRWHKWHEPIEDIWKRHRMTPLDASGDPESSQIWQYDYEILGARMVPEQNMSRFIERHAFGDRLEDPDYSLVADFKPYGWYNPWQDDIGPRPETRVFQLLSHTHFERIDRPDGSWYYEFDPDSVGPSAYFQIDNEPCPKCGGVGCIRLENPDRWEECDLCRGFSFDGTGETRVAAAFGEFVANLRSTPDFNAFMGNIPAEEMPGAVAARDLRFPIVLSEEYFKYGIGVGVWHQKDVPMMFYRTSRDPFSEPGEEGIARVGGEVQPDWGFVAMASARCGVPSDAGHVYRFEDYAGNSDPVARQMWLESDYNLYAADIRAKLIGVKEQVADDAFDEEILIGAVLDPDMHDNPTLYILDAIFRSGRHQYGNNIWRHLRKDEEDTRVGELLRQMGGSDYRARVETLPDDHIAVEQLPPVDLRDPDIEEIVRH